MSDDVNFVAISGRLTRTPEIRETPSGATVMDFSIACNRYVNGEQRTTYFKTTLWNKAAEWFGQRLGTGDQVMIQGKLVDDNFTQQDGAKTSGRLKIDNAHISILNRADHSASAQSADDDAPEPTPEPIPEV